MRNQSSPSPATVSRDQLCKSAITDNHKSYPFFRFIKASKRAFAAAFLFWRKRPKPKILEGETRTTQTPIRDLSYSSAGSEKKGLGRLRNSSSRGSSTAASASGELGTVDLSFDEICKGTGNFSASNKIGEGRFGTVYKAKLRDGSCVAIKRARKDNYDNRLTAEFKNEIMVLSKIEHLNLVRYYGYLEHRDEKIIVVEYVSNGTLREHLDGAQGKCLEMAERLDIAIDVAHAITYLHMYTDPPIIHRDIKSTNIFITDNFHAKVSDFGFARLAAEEDAGATHISTQVKGTAGYLDPEYLKTYQLTEKSDVYSFGVLLVEIVTGRSPIEQTFSSDEKLTTKWALKILKRGDTVMAMDPRLRRSPGSVEAVDKVLKLAHLCVAPSRSARPSMRKCAEVLWRIRKEFRDRNVHSTAASASYYTAFVGKNPPTPGVDFSDKLKFAST
ncbi:calmodulin-binding receptor-like cytoplasmic kinase 2 [Ipomoea triloba]|uniref:calmodulin-binding receptor-like cytoplasmic kinase 2 n=1 Tax=Ipomoea triloba TaxID=35885 RepID=UPI00125E2CF2|nr:calmodulin-binding receptor-like cytoplasmic kinase 2 [Ipomoea triloba]